MILLVALTCRSGIANIGPREMEQAAVERDVISERLARVVEAALGDRELGVSCAVLDSTRADVSHPFASIGLDIPERLVTKRRLFDKLLVR